MQQLCARYTLQLRPLWSSSRTDAMRGPHCTAVAAGPTSIMSFPEQHPVCSSVAETWLMCCEQSIVGLLPQSEMWCRARVGR